MKHRDFTYVGFPVPYLNEQEHHAFFLNFQQAVLLSLEQKNLLTHAQYERCIKILENSKF